LTVEYLGGANGASLIDVDRSHFMRRQRSDLSDNFKISCSPEAESYFRRKAESLYDRAVRGELEVEVRSADDGRGKEGEQGLKVLPVFTSEDKDVVEIEEVEVTDLTAAPALEVKPVPLPRTLVKRSSYESLYDTAKLEGVVASSSCEAGTDKTIVFGDRFTGTYDKPKAASSFEKLYSGMSENADDDDVDVAWSGQVMLEADAAAAVAVAAIGDAMTQHFSCAEAS